MQMSASIKILLIFILSLSFSVPGMAESYHYFNDKVQSISSQLDKKNIEHDELFLLISESLLLRTQLDECVIKNEKKLAALNQLLLDKNVEVELGKNQKTWANLASQKKEILANIGRCKLLLFQIHDLLVRANDLKGDKILFKLYQKQAIPTAIDLAFNLQPGFDSQFFIHHTMVLSILTLIGLLVSFFLYRINTKLALRFSWFNLVQKNLAIWFPFGIILIYLIISLPQTSVLKPLSLQLFTLLSLFFLIKFCLMLAVKDKLWTKSTAIRLLFNVMILLISIGLVISIPLRSRAGFFISPFFFHFRFTVLIVWVWLYVESLDWYKETFPAHVKTMLGMLAGILSVIFLRFCIKEFHHYQIISDSAAYIYTALYIALFNLMLCCTIWVVIQEKKTTLKVLSNAYLNASVLGLTYFISLFFLFKGYFFTAENLIVNLIITIMLIRLFYDHLHFRGKMSGYLSALHVRFPVKIREKLGLKLNEKPVDVYLFYLALSLGVLLVFLAAFVISWGGSFNELNFLVRQTQDGFVLFEATIYPARIFRAIFVFCLLLIAGRFLATYVSNMALFSDEKHTKLTIHSLIRYIVFGIAFIFSLIVSGVNTTHIALVTGALSFGLGFGLQHFASDFVSGLFLLVNRPVKIGDHIAVEEDEGFIKKIGLFSTRMSTLEQADLIIPNSILITNSVKNLTFENNKLHTIKISIIPEEGANLELCYRLLLEVAQKNINVVKSSTIHPIVLFDKNMLTLSCTIINVNKKDIIISELSFAITNKFAEHNITVTLS